MMKAEVIYTDRANQPTGPFVQAIKAGNLLFLSGFRGIDPKTNKVPKGDFRAEAKLVLENIKVLVEKAGGTMANVVATTVYVRDMYRFRPVVNELYEEYFGKNLPTRTIVEISRLNGDDNVEITATAWIP
jgi:2-iminobutanoate/2-iminopropanoate deaminase